MKKNKFLSSLTLASMIVSGVAGTTLADNSTAFAGEFKPGTLKNVSDKTVASYLLTDYKDVLKVEEMLKLGKYPNIKINGQAVSNDTVVKTGDNFTVGSSNDKKHVVVYGDVDMDGNVDVDDVTYAANIVVKNEKNASNLQIEAADSEYNGTLDVDDVTRLSRFAVNMEDSAVYPAPKAEEEKYEDLYNITVNGGATANAENIDGSAIVATLKSGRVEVETELSLRYVNEKGEAPEENELGTITLEKYANQGDGSINLSSLVNGEESKEVTLRLYNDKDEQVGEIKVTIDTRRPEAVQISARREGSYGAHLSFNGSENSDVVKAYYKVVKYNAAALQKTDMFENNGKGKAKEGIKVLEGLNNACVDKAVEGVLETNKGAAVYFVVENSVGNRSTTVYKAVIPQDEGVTVENPAKGADETPEKKDKVSYNDTLTFTWDKDANSNGYIVRVFDESDKLIKEYDNVAEASKQLNGDMNKEGKYTVEVVVKGKNDGSTKDSKAIKSDVVEVKRLAPVEGITFVTDPSDYTKATLKWTDSAKHEDKDKDSKSDDKAKEYSIKLQAYKGTGDIEDDNSWEDAGLLSSSSTGTVDIPASNLQVNLTSIDPNTLYRAKIQVVSDGEQKIVLSSDTVTSMTNYFVIGTDVITLEGTTANSATFTVNEDALKKLGEREFSYEVEIYKDVKSGDTLVDRTPERRTLALTDGKLVIDGLEENTEYKFVIKMKTGNVEGETSRNDTTALTAKTKITAPVVTGTVTKDEETARVKGDKKVYLSGNTLIVNGDEYDITGNYDDPDKLLQIAKTLIPQLDEKDVINSIEKEIVSVTIGSEATDESNPIDLSLSTTPIKTLKLVGNNYNQTINTLTGVEKLELSNGEFTVKLTNVDPSNGGVKVELAEGAHVLNATKVTIAKGAHVTVNGVAIYAQNGAELTADGVNLTLEPSGDNKIEINNETTSDMIVKFNGDARLGDKQLGTITITSNAKVTVSTENTARVDAQVTVNTTDADIDVQDEGLAGHIDVKVSNSSKATHKITAYAKVDAPFKMTNLEVREYTEKELKEGVATIENYNKEDEEDIAKIQEYMVQYKAIWGKKIELTVDPTSKGNERKIELTIPKGETVNISDLDIIGIVAK